MSDVAIFGIGPAGMVTAWAALRAGYGVKFYSDGVTKSTLYGCQYLHAPIPLPGNIEIAKTRVEYRLQGTVAGYRTKIYGDKYGGRVSVEDLEGDHDAWDIRATYDALWNIITRHKKVSIFPIRLEQNWIGASTKLLSSFAHVVSTIPAPSLCLNPTMLPNMPGHYFASHKIRASGTKLPAFKWDDIVVCDGTEVIPWYRMAVVFGYRTTEWPRGTASHLIGERATSVSKPLYNDCDCHPEIFRLGRYGAWTKGILVHQVYESAVKLFNGEWI